MRLVAGARASYRSRRPGRKGTEEGDQCASDRDGAAAVSFHVGFLRLRVEGGAAAKAGSSAGEAEA